LEGEWVQVIERAIGDLIEVHPDLHVKEAALHWMHNGTVPNSDHFHVVPHMTPTTTINELC
jgi:hypothetical protein